MKTRKESSETTGLLPQGNSSNSRASLELGSFLSTENEDVIMEDDLEDFSALLKKSETRNRKPQSPPRAVRTALVLGLLVCGVTTIRLLGFTFTSSDNSTNVPTNASSRKGSILGSVDSYWDDETHQQWEDFLVAGSSAAKPMMVQGSLLGTVEEESSSSSSSSSSNLLYFNQTSAFGMLDPNADFFHYQNGWEAQITQALCAVATTAALINSFRDLGPQFVLPMDPVYSPFPWATQANILNSADTNPCVLDAVGGTIFNRDAVYHMGLGLAMVPNLANCFLESNGYHATGYSAAAVSEKTNIKALVVEALKDPSHRVIYNYDRGGIGQGPLGHGHWSPLGGYHEATDSFLVMDVSKYKHPMVWVSWDDLWSGAATMKDNCGQALSFEFVDWSKPFKVISDNLQGRCIPGSRGFVVVSPVDGEL